MTNYTHKMNCIKNRIPIISNKFSEKIIKPPFPDEYEWEDGDIPWGDEDDLWENEPWEDGEVPWDEPSDNKTSIKKFPTKKPTQPPVSNYMLATLVQ